MADWCSNTVIFDFGREVLKSIQALFECMAEKEAATNHGQLPPFHPEGDGWLSDIRWEDGVLNYKTRWVPNTAVVTSVVEHFKAGFTHSYEKPNNWVYGEAVYRDGVLKDVFLEPEDFEVFDLVEEEGKDGWLFEGAFIESDYDIKDILLDRRKALAKER